MGFKMNGSPAKMGTISGTAGHSSALKMKAEQDAASPAKQFAAWEAIKAKGEEVFNKEDTTEKPPTEDKNPYADAKKKDPKLDEYISIQKANAPGSDVYEANQAKINAAYGKTRSKKLKAAQIKNNSAVVEDTSIEDTSKGKRDSIIGDENKDGNMLTRGLKKVFKKASPEKIAQRKADKTEAKKQGISVWQLKKNRKSPAKHTRDKSHKHSTSETKGGGTANIATYDDGTKREIKKPLKRK